MTNENKSVRYLLPIATILIVILGVILLIHAHQVTPVRADSMTVNQKIHLECQKLAATTYNENWSYKSCVEAIKNADKVSAKILSI